MNLLPAPNPFAEIEAFWADPTPYEYARIAGQAAINALFADHEARVRAEQAARWAREDEA